MTLPNIWLADPGLPRPQKVWSARCGGTPRCCFVSDRIRTEAPDACFGAFSSREPAPTSLENALRRWYFRAFGCLETAARPDDGDHRAVVGEGSDEKHLLCARASQQRTRQEHTEPAPTSATLARCIVGTAPARKMGF